MKTTRQIIETLAIYLSGAHYKEVKAGNHGDDTEAYSCSYCEALKEAKEYLAKPGISVREALMRAYVEGWEGWNCYESTDQKKEMVADRLLQEIGEPVKEDHRTVCPKCGKDDFSYQDPEIDADECRQVIVCSECGHEWLEVYTFDHNEDKNVETEQPEPSDSVTCSQCGETITDAEHDDNGGLCDACAEEAADGTD